MSLIMTYMSYVSYHDIRESCLLSFTFVKTLSRIHLPTHTHVYMTAGQEQQEGLRHRELQRGARETTRSIVTAIREKEIDSETKTETETAKEGWGGGEREGERE
jgi:hypothetical protein